jgi:hypothetical protein
MALAVGCGAVGGHEDLEARRFGGNDQLTVLQARPTPLVGRLDDVGA